MRLKIFGISKIGLAFFGLLPALAWFAFGRSWGGEVGILILMAALFPYFFCRGFFRIRFGMWLALGLELLYEMLVGMQDRDFLRIGRACLVFLIAIGVGKWIEKKVASASLNPQIKWFEGAPLTLPHGTVKLSVSGETVDGKLRRADNQGFFVFLEARPEFKAGEIVPFELEFKGSEVKGEARLSSCFLGENIGFGLQFFPKDLYHFSQYTSLVSRMRGEGL